MARRADCPKCRRPSNTCQRRPPTASHLDCPRTIISRQSGRNVCFTWMRRQSQVRWLACRPMVCQKAPRRCRLPCRVDPKNCRLGPPSMSCRPLTLQQVRHRPREVPRPAWAGPWHSWCQPHKAQQPSAIVGGASNDSNGTWSTPVDVKKQFKDAVWQPIADEIWRSLPQCLHS